MVDGVLTESIVFRKVVFAILIPPLIRATRILRFSTGPWKGWRATFLGTRDPRNRSVDLPRLPAPIDDSASFCSCL